MHTVQKHNIYYTAYLSSDLYPKHESCNMVRQRNKFWEELTVSIVLQIFSASL
jgi:hypothetical protein